MPAVSATIEARLLAELGTFTRAEAQLAHAILDNYPVSGLGSITVTAHNAGVSTPTVVRMVQKLGFKGFPEFQAKLREELAAIISTPMQKLDAPTNKAPRGHILHRFSEAAFDNIRHTLHQIDTGLFDEACMLLADVNRSVFIAGGRITRTLADYFFLHMQVNRKNVTYIQSISNAWPHFVLNISKGDVLVVFDVRRYENSTLKLAEMAAERKARIVLFTDQWRSPVSKYAGILFGCRIAAPSAWDSSVATLLLLEAMIAAVQQRTGAHSKRRMEALEGMFDRTSVFRKFS